METTKYFYDDNFVRYQLVKTNPGHIINNWLFVPGGPGADSSYFVTLIENLDVPGNFWLIDLPANGSNISDHIRMDYNFETWENCFLTSIQKFQNPLGASHDFITPYSLFENDKRFVRKNITLKKIEDAGHFPWLEQMNIVKSEFKSLIDNYSLLS